MACWLKEKNLKESPIFAKTYDLLNWVSNHVSRFPKSERFRLARRIEEHVFDFHAALVHAVRNKDSSLETLKEADEMLYRLKIYFRLSRDRGFSSQSQYQFVSGQLIEIGKLLGGWMKKIGL